jgi:hypothetical protein
VGFREAYNIASQFTFPVAHYWHTYRGDTAAGIAALVVVNLEGWVVTAAHVVKEASKLAQMDSDARALEKQVDAIKSAERLSAKERTKQLKALGMPDRKAPCRGVTSWGFPDSRLRDIEILDSADLAVGRLDPFDPAWVTCYPQFKDPTKDFMPGASLCKLGFPFPVLHPTYNEAKGFVIPPEEMRIPRFPIEGIFTRTIVRSGVSSAYPIMFVETSSPGLRGQSGGPIFDVSGTVWAIQSQTRSLALGFTPEIRHAGQAVKEHPFLNVGIGVHVETVLGLFNSLGIKHNVSSH